MKFNRINALKKNKIRCALTNYYSKTTILGLIANTWQIQKQ